MKYGYTQTANLDELITQLDTYQFFVQNAPVSAEVRHNLRRQTQLKSSLFSARIEGNRLTLDQLEQGLSNPKMKEKIEINNLVEALNVVFSSQAPPSLDLTFIRKLHQVVMNGLASHAGQFRREITAIFNQAGVAIYMTPPPEEIEPQLNSLIAYQTSTSDHLYIRTAISHYWFEKIHPFVDGNGRVGRLLTQYNLDRAGHRFQGLLSFEEHIEATRNDYYYLLQQESHDLTEFIQYMLECWVKAGISLVEQLKRQPLKSNPEELLLPRRQEILNLLRDHQYLSFDQIQRRFYGVNQSTLRHDLRQLIRQNMVQKIGATRGALYQARKL